MHNRIIAFFISSNSVAEPSYQKAVAHLQLLATSFSKKITNVELETYHLHLVYEGNIDKLVQKNGNAVKFCVGPHTSRKNSGWTLSSDNRKFIRGRFLHVTVENRKISITNDYVGSIPVYYSLRKHVSLSNIEPVVVKDSKTCYRDLVPEAVYELFRYTYLIGDETLYCHIKTQDSDSTFIYTNQKDEPVKKYNLTITSSEERWSMKTSDVLDEMNELNRFLVHESLSQEKDIVLPLSSGYDSRIILTSAIQDEKIKSKLNCYTYSPNMSLESRPAGEICKLCNVRWKKIQLSTNNFSMKRLEQIGLIFGSGLHFHGKYQLDFIDQIKNVLIPGESVFVSGFMTGISSGSTFSSKLKFKDNNLPFTTAINELGESKYITDEYLFTHSRKLNPEMKYSVESNFRKVFSRIEGHDHQKLIVFDTWSRQKNFISYQPRTMTWENPYIGPHTTPEFINFCLSLPPKLLKNCKAVEMVMGKYYSRINKVSSNSNLTVKHILKRSFCNPFEGVLHYAPLLIKYFFKQPWLLPKPLLAEMKNPVVPDLRSIGKNGVSPIFNLNGQSREIFDEYFSYKEVDNLFAYAMTGDELASKRLTVLQTLAYALKQIEN